MPLRIYNTLTRQKEDFETLEPGRVGMYLCGPTVYKPAHIGHMVGPVIYDTVKRYLVYNNYEVTFVVNITDIDDKLIKRAGELGTSVASLAEAMTKDYRECLAAFGVNSVDHFPKATDHIGEMLAIIDRLVETGHAYPLDGDVYFDTSADDDYGKLSHRSTAEMMAGTRAEITSGKKNPADFALWKRSREGEPSWDSKYGPGRPGWHIECSAMSMEYLGETLDIHGGGLDLMFPHHENELAQSECCTGKPFARYWLHNGLMQADSSSGKVGGGHSRDGDQPVDGAAGSSPASDQASQERNKMAGSAGADSVKKLFVRFHPQVLRFFLLQNQYRSPILFGENRIAEAAKSLDGFYRLFETAERILSKTGSSFSFYSLPAPMRRTDSPELTGEPADYYTDLSHLRNRFLDAMDDDFNTGGAMGVLFDLRKRLNGFLAEHNLEDEAAEETMKTAFRDGLLVLRELSNLLGIFAEPIGSGGGGADDEFVEGLMQMVIKLRADARASKNFDVADQIRDHLNALSVVLEDRTDETLWSRD